MSFSLSERNRLKGTLRNKVNAILSAAARLAKQPPS
ncbi:MAG: hypothetical protein RIS92_1524 [Verrucomicrobiota bacterium]